MKLTILDVSTVVQFLFGFGIGIQGTHFRITKDTTSGARTMTRNFYINTWINTESKHETKKHEQIRPCKARTTNNYDLDSFQKRKTLPSKSTIIKSKQKHNFCWFNLMFHLTIDCLTWQKSASCQLIN